jgi:2-oxoglutarate/2-oxoacid ferredoxin oxidoreductase subunit beta
MIAAAQKHKSEAKKFDVEPDVENQWCPGCGNFPILATVKKALTQAKFEPHETVFVSGIGQAAKLPQYMNAHYFNGLHGRALPVATGVKAANPSLNVVVSSGDGDIYGEGGNHFIHTVRRNPNITVIVHDNMIYGLTKGQAAPTTRKGMVTPTQPRGVYDEPINPMTFAIGLDASFVARANAGDPVQAQEIIAQAMEHDGFALVDIFQPCVVFNKKNTYQWFKEHSYTLGPDHDPTDRMQAFARATEEDAFPLGILYRNEKRETFENMIGIYDDDKRPLHKREIQRNMIDALLETRK